MDFQGEIRLFSNLWYYHFNFILCMHKESLNNQGIMVGVREFLLLQSVQISSGSTQSPFQWICIIFGGNGGGYADPEAEFMFHFKKVC